MGKKVNQTELAEIVGVSDVSLWQWQKEEMPVDVRNTRGQSNVYDTADVIAWMVDRAVKRVRNESPRDALARAQTDLVLITIAEKNGTLVPLADVESEYDRMVTQARQRILQISASLPLDAATRTLLDHEVAEALQELSRYDSSAGNDRTGLAEVGAAGEALGVGVGGGEAVPEREELPVPGAVPVLNNPVPPGAG